MKQRGSQFERWWRKARHESDQMLAKSHFSDFAVMMVEEQKTKKLLFCAAIASMRSGTAEIFQVVKLCYSWAQGRLNGETPPKCVNGLPLSSLTKQITSMLTWIQLWYIRLWLHKGIHLILCCGIPSGFYCLRMWTELLEWWGQLHIRLILANHLLLKLTKLASSVAYY